MKKFLIFNLLILVLVISSIFLIGGRPGRSTATGKLPESLRFAHRGVLSQHIENSAKSLLATLALKDSLQIEGIEIDVRQTMDHALILFHDASADRLLGRDLTIQKTSWKALEKWPFEGSTDHIISLDSALSLIGDSLYIYLDLKEADNRMVDLTIALLKKHGLLHKAVLASSDFRVLMYAKRRQPHVQTVLEGMKEGKLWLLSLIPHKWQPDYLACFLSDLSDQHLKAIKSKALQDQFILYGVDKRTKSDPSASGILRWIQDY